MKPFPIYRQHDAMLCGTTCLRMVAEYFGQKYSAAELDKLCPATAEGVSLLGISRAAEKLGLHSVCGRLTIEELQTAPMPCILHWNQNHFVVLYKVKTRRGKSTFYIADPGKGLTSYTQKEFEQGWISTLSNGQEKGIIMLFSLTPKFGSYKREASNNPHTLVFVLKYISIYK